MGEVILFKLAQAGRANLAPGGSSTIILFTGIRRERIDEQSPVTKSVRQVQRKRSEKGKGKAEGSSK